jgi:hypothetical protein
MPPGVRHVPGLSSAVRGSVHREVQQMLAKVSYVAGVVRRGVCVVVCRRPCVPGASLSAKRSQLHRATHESCPLTRYGCWPSGVPPAPVLPACRCVTQAIRCGLGPQAALQQVAREVMAAGGSFKRLACAQRHSSSSCTRNSTAGQRGGRVDVAAGGAADHHVPLAGAQEAA